MFSFFDINGDGKPDLGIKDTDGDGIPDSIIDLDGNEIPGLSFQDTDGNGIPDSIIDFRGNTVLEFNLVDADGDGILELVDLGANTLNSSLSVFDKGLLNDDGFDAPDNIRYEEALETPSDLKIHIEGSQEQATQLQEYFQGHHKQVQISFKGSFNQVNAADSQGFADSTMQITLQLPQTLDDVAMLRQLSEQGFSPWVPVIKKNGPQWIPLDDYLDTIETRLK